jgi:hypothetical protein
MMDNQVELNKYTGAVWRAKWWILAAIVLAGLGTAGYRYRQPATYTAVALIRIGRVWKEPLEDPFQTAEVVNSHGFLDEVARKLSIKPGQLRRSIQASAVTAGPARATYPILVRVSASTDSNDQSIQFVEAVATEVVARHQTLWDEAMAPHLETERNLEELAKSSAAASGASLDARIKLEQELGEIRSSNRSPTITEKTHILVPVTPQGVARPTIWRPAAVAAVSAGLVVMSAAVLIAFAGSSPRQARLGAADKAADKENKELSDAASG